MRNKFKAWGNTCVSDKDVDASLEVDPTRIDCHGEMTVEMHDGPVDRPPMLLTVLEAKKRGWFSALGEAATKYAHDRKKTVPKTKQAAFFSALRLLSMGRIEFDIQKEYPPDPDEVSITALPV